MNSVSTDREGIFFNLAVAYLLEQITDSRCSHSHKDLDELRSWDREERYTSFSCNGLCQQSLSCSWWSYQKNSLGDLCSYCCESLWLLQEFNHLQMAASENVHVLHSWTKRVIASTKQSWIQSDHSEWGQGQILACCDCCRFWDGHEQHQKMLLWGKRIVVDVETCTARLLIVNQESCRLRNVAIVPRDSLLRTHHCLNSTEYA